jgi:uncharacterized membrane protein YhaH (DUF805 family)
MWNYSVGNEIKGPIGEPEIVGLIQWGVITKESLVWKEGMPGWVPVVESTLAPALAGPPVRPAAATTTVARALPTARPVSLPYHPVASPPVHYHKPKPVQPQELPMESAPRPGSDPTAVMTPTGQAPLIDRALPPPPTRDNYYATATARDPSKSSPNSTTRSKGVSTPHAGRNGDVYAPPLSSIDTYHSPSQLPSLGQVLFSFDGRAPRRQYWGVSLGIVAAFFLQGLIAALLFPMFASMGGGGILEVLTLLVFAVFACVALWSSLAITAKRWHDRGKSGWMILVAFIPVIGGLWTLIECGFLRGTEGRNAYGSDPT